MLNLGNSVYLLAALGIVVPLLIHLWNRKPLRIIEVGSIRWLKGSSTRSTRSLRLEEWPLLLLRCLMLFLFSLLLAGLYWERNGEEEVKKARHYLVHPQALPQLSQAAIDSLEGRGWQIRLLAPGLPALSDSLLWLDKPVEAIDAWAVLREADQVKEMADCVWIQTSLLQEAFGGERPALHKTYIFEEGDDMPQSAVVHTVAIQLENDVYLQQAVSAAERIEIRKDTLSGDEWNRLKQERQVNLSQPTELKVSLLVADRYKRDGEILRYALEVALGADPSTKLLLNTDMDQVAGSDVLVYLKDGALPDSLPGEKTILLRYAETEIHGSRWFRQDFRRPDRQVYMLTARVLPERVAREKLSRLPLELSRILQHDEQQKISGYLLMPVAQAQPLKATARAGYLENDLGLEDLHEWLWLLLFGLFVTERIWVYQK